MKSEIFKMWIGKKDTNVSDTQGYKKVGLDSPRKDIEMTELNSNRTTVLDYGSDGSINNE